MKSYRGYIINEVKSLLKTNDNFSKEEVDYLLMCLYDRLKRNNKEFLKRSQEILSKIVALDIDFGEELTEEKSSKEDLKK